MPRSKGRVGAASAPPWPWVVTFVLVNVVLPIPIGIVFGNMKVSLIVLVAFLPASLLWGFSRPWAKRLVPRLGARVVIGTAICVLAFFGLLYGVLFWHSVDVLGVETAPAGQEVAVAMALLSLQQQISHTKVSGSPTYETHLQIRDNAGSIAVHNTSRMPLLLSADVLIEDSSDRIGSVDTITPKWRGATSRSIILVPDFRAHLDFVAFGATEGWYIPGYGTVAHSFCVNFLTPDVKFRKGVLSLLCQSRWFSWASFDTARWVIVQVRLSAQSLGDLSGAPVVQTLRFRIHPGSNTNAIDIVPLF